ncbi:SGNH/GDSL hydrolase family protein [Lusitaniella coriacea]|uniref:SGNH/GDSL hydrolase family protein n=1 Tax=Lusitaniella coriacea TaxID=1983105 RepID=UPI003CEAC629
MKQLLILIAVPIILAIAAEVSLRLLFGLGNPPLYIADDKIGYLLAPNQRLRRMGNLIAINEYSMRTGAIAQKRDSNTLRVFLLGDSVANGAWWTDQKQTISTLMHNQLSQSGQTVEVLNASANSWSPRNELAYLQRFGLFGSQVLVLLINTDDLFGTAPTSLPVGRDLNYPNRKPPLALIELYNRYGKKSKPIPGMKEVQNEEGDRVGFNLEAIAGIRAISQHNNAKLLLAHTPLRRELGEPGPRDYELTARKRLLDLTEAQNIPYLDFLPAFNAHPQPETLYRDHIHLSPEGNQFVSERLSQQIDALSLN